MGVNYDVKAFRADLKDVLRKAGLEGKAVCIFLEDHQLAHSSVLQAVNSLLSGGEVPGLFTNEELAKELPALEARRAQDLAAPPSGSLFSYFSLSVQRNLHIVVSLDASSTAYRARCDANPALFTRCSCLWMDGWADQSMEHVAQAALQVCMAPARCMALLVCSASSAAPCLISPCLPSSHPSTSLICRHASQALGCSTALRLHCSCRG
jgi:dynein heavy chain 2, cytosolic